MSRIDLHLHTTHSDGSLSPTDVLRLAHKAGVTALAITDHDIVTGIPEAIAAGAELGIEIIPGVEIEMQTEKILGYTATKYLVTDKTSKSEVWLAEGLGTFMGMSNRNPMAGGRGAGSAAPGWERALEGKELFPLRIVGLDKAGKENSRMEVTAIDKATLPDSCMRVPISCSSVRQSPNRRSRAYVRRR